MKNELSRHSVKLGAIGLIISLLLLILPACGGDQPDADASEKAAEPAETIQQENIEETGEEGDIEKEWQAYLEELERAGLSSAIKIRQTAYNRYLLK